MLTPHILPSTVDIKNILERSHARRTGNFYVWDFLVLYFHNFMCVIYTTQESGDNRFDSLKCKKHTLWFCHKGTGFCAKKNKKINPPCKQSPRAMHAPKTPN